MRALIPLLLLPGLVLADTDPPPFRSGGSNVNADAGAVSNADSISSATSGDQVTNLDSRAIALGNVMGDVDIADCRESEQFGTPLFSRQWIKLNPWCAAEIYDAKGLFELAARTRCTIKEISRLFDSNAECVAANRVTERIDPMPALAAHEDRDEEIERQLEITLGYAEQLAQRLEEVESRANRRIVEQVPLLSDEQRSELQKLREE